MSETPSTGETIAYQPISGWAIAGLAVSGLFTLMVLASAVVGLFQGAPVFFPIWLLSFAAAGAILSYIGQWQIENSENTRTGLKLARLGLWLGVLSGLSYLTYFYVTGWALETQANSFLMDETNDDSGFFPRVRKGGKQLNAAFLLTRPAHMRTGRWDDEKSMSEHHDSPGEKGTPGELTLFREFQLPRVLYQHLGDQAEITPGPVLDWKYENRSYAVKRVYHIKTIEMEADFHVAVHSSEGEAEGQGRKWYLNTRETFLIAGTLKLTPLGQGVKNAKEHARKWLQDWIDSLNNGAAYPEIDKKDKTAWDVIPVRIVVDDPAKARAKARELTHRLFTRDDKLRFLGFRIYYDASRPDLDLGKWEVINGRLRIYYGFQFTSTIERRGAAAQVRIDATATLETRQALNLADFTETSQAPQWDLVAVSFTQVVQLRN